MSPPKHPPSAQRRGTPGLRRGLRPLLVVAGVLLLHAAALSGLAGVGGGPAATAAAGPVSTPVRTRVVAAAPTGPESAAAPRIPEPAAARPVAPAPTAAPPEPAPPPAPAPRENAARGAAAPDAAPVPPAPATEAAAPAAPAAAPKPPPADEAPALPGPEGAPLQLAQASGPAAASPEATPAATPARRVPRYRASLPPAFEARFQMRRGLLAGQADWRYAPEGARYRLELHTKLLGREISHLRSEGQTAAAGLEPLRFVDGRRGRDQRAINFQRDAPGGGHISFSGPATQLPLPVGVQDRLSWLLQLAAIVDADPALRQRGAEVSMWVVSPRGEADLWTFVVAGPEPLAQQDGGGGTALALRRAPDRAFDTEVQVWLDPAAHHLPLRATWRNEGDSAAVDLRRESLAWR